MSSNLYKRFTNYVRLKKNELIGSVPVSMGDVSFRGNAENWRFWRRVSRRNWEPNTIRMLDTVLEKSDIFIDIGAFVGPTAIYSSFRCKKVLCLEPDPVAYEFLLKNIRLNGIKNISTIHCALHKEVTTLKLAGVNERLGDSVSSLLFGDNKNSVEVACLPLELALSPWNLTKAKLLKMDIEGAEFDVLPDIQDTLLEYANNFHISTHAPYFDESDRVKKMALLVPFFEKFQYIYDDDLALVTASQITDEKYAGSFPEFLLTNTPYFSG